MRRPVIALVVALAVLGLFAGGLARLLDTPSAPRGAALGERLYDAACVTCHGVDGHGSWKAALFLIRPGDLGDRQRMSQQSDDYLFNIIKNGGAPIGRPGMPAFGQFNDDEIHAIIAYLRTLPDRPAER